MSSDPSEKGVSLPRLSSMMVKASLPKDIRNEALDAFQDEFEERVEETGLVKAKLWSLRQAWRVYYDEYKAEIQAMAIVLALAGLLFA